MPIAAEAGLGSFSKPIITGAAIARNQNPLSSVSVPFAYFIGRVRKSTVGLQRRSILQYQLMHLTSFHSRG